jgi:hypothetical protein
MQTFLATFRNCATCGRWGGQRSTDPFGSAVQANQSTQGKCLGGAYNTMQTVAGSTCQQYVKWSALR